LLNVGDVAPDFEAVTDSGARTSLNSLKGEKFVLYFYPKDDTPGCTAEACSIRDSYHVFLAKGIPVFGVSGGSAGSHRKFRQKYNLPFPLLVDEKLELAKKYDVLKSEGKIARTTFLIDENGKIEGIFGDKGTEKVVPKEHATQIIDFWSLGD